MDPPPTRRFNIVRLIMLHVRKFEMTNPLEALHYYYILRNLVTHDNKNLFMVCISDLARETRSFEQLFGKMQLNGIRTSGLVDQFITTNMTTEMICELTAEDLKNEGLHEDAIKVYYLADDHEEVIGLLSVLLAQVVTQISKPGSQRERLGLLAHEIINRYSSSGYRCTAPKVSTFKTLIEQMKFFDQYHNGQYELAKETLTNMSLIPLNINEVSERVAAYRRLSPEITKVIPDLLLAAMTILYEQYKYLKNSTANVSKFDETAFKVNIIMEIKNLLANILVFFLANSIYS